MLTDCHHWDVGREPPPAVELTKRLEQLSHTEALLVLCKTSFPPDWDQACFYELLTGPSKYARAYTLRPQPDSLARESRRKTTAWLSRFDSLRQEAERNRPFEREAAELAKEIRAQILQEESATFPIITAYLRYPRVTQTLTYEHNGIRHYLSDLEPTLKTLSSERIDKKKTWSRFQLNLIHLIEHHLEHEEPVLTLAAGIAESDGQQPAFVGKRP